MENAALSGSRYRREFSLPGDPDAIPPVIEAVLAFLRETGCGADDEAAISLALQEGLSNAVAHGCGNDPGKTVLCEAGRESDGSVIISIRDPGCGFDPARVPSPLTLEGMPRDHGRGIHLMRNLMDEVRFEKNGTQLILRKS